MRLEKEKDLIKVKAPVPEYLEKGFSLLIKAPGSYILKDSGFSQIPPGGVFFEVYGPDQKFAGSEGKKGFSARFPLVFRAYREGDLLLRAGQKRRLSDILKKGNISDYTGFITAQDPEGPAAFMAISGGKNILLLCREASTEAAVFVAVSADGSVEIFGGIDV
jgi:hypothetical protein